MEELSYCKSNTANTLTNKKYNSKEQSIHNPNETICKEMDTILLLLKAEYKTKIEKIGIASYDETAIICLKRISRNKRCFIYYKDFIELYEKNNSDFEIIEKIEKSMVNGLVIVLLNEDIFMIQENENTINQFIFQRIGSNLNISAIILIKRCHNNKFLESSKLNNILEKFDKLKEENNWTILQKIKNDNSGNDKWTGHYAIDTRGGTQNGKREGEIQLANNISEYCNNEISTIIKYQMVYYMFYCKESEKFLTNEDKNKIEKYKDLFKNYCEINNLDIHLNLCHYIDNEILTCCISYKPISYADFENDKIQLCHLQPVTKHNIQYNEKYGLITSHHYVNLAWGFKTANMAQLDNSLEDTNKFIIEMTNNILKRKLKNASCDEEKKNIENALYYLELCNL